MDRTLRGLVAGILAGIVMDTWNLFDYYFLLWTKIRFLDWAAVLATWAKPDDALTTVFFLITHLLWDGLLGIIFAHLLVKITSKGMIIKSCYFGFIVWFIFKIIVNLFRVPLLSGVQPELGAYSNVFAVVLWGLSLGFFLKMLDKPARGG